MDPTERPSFVIPQDEPAHPAVARPSATVIVVRDMPGGLECFMLERHLNSDFVGGAYVFPGGTVDDRDRDVELVKHVNGISHDVRRALGEDALGFVVCAIRETFEEAGILFARHASGEPVQLRDEERWVEYRRALNAREITALDLARDANIVFAADLLRFWWRLVTPEFAPRRYDAPFFVAHMPEGQEPLHDEVETTASRWVRPLEAAEAGRAGKFQIIFPTRKTLEQIGEHATSEQVFAAAIGRDPTPLLPRIEMIDGEPRILLPDGSVHEP
jgi:8-oxo-dGTP pyrophosphatase MutT (NUDIX family)